MLPTWRNFVVLGLAEAVLAAATLAIDGPKIGSFALAWGGGFAIGVAWSWWVQGFDPNTREPRREAANDD